MRRFYYVDDGVPSEGTEFLRASCEERDVEFVPVDPFGFEFDPERQLQAGDLLYRPAISFLSQQVEQFIYAPGVSTFYTDPDGPYFGTLNPSLHFQRAGLPIPRTIFCHTTDRAVLQRYAQRLGGFPLIFKVPGFSGGVGVVRVESLATLYALVDYSSAMNRMPLLMAYVPDAVHWRMVVVGDRVVGSYRNVIDEGDFRTSATADTTDYEVDPPPGMAEIAVAAPKVMRLEFGGVDLLHHEASGRIYLLESNFPCYYAQAQRVTGVDTSGAMIDHLLAKADRSEADA